MSESVFISYTVFMVSTVSAGFGIDARNEALLFMATMGMLAVLMLRRES